MVRTSVQAVLLDIDGVLVVSWEPLDGAVAALRASGYDVRFLTNTTSRTRASIAEAPRAPAADERRAAGDVHGRTHRSGMRSRRGVMVGDDVRSDVLGAQAAGLVGVLVRMHSRRDRLR